MLSRITVLRSIDSVGLFVFDSINPTVQYNEVYGTQTASSSDADGIDIDGGSQNAIVQYNYTHDNQGAGLLVNTYSDNSGGGGAITNTDNVTIRYNVSQNDRIVGELWLCHHREWRSCRWGGSGVIDQYSLSTTTRYISQAHRKR